MDISLGTFLSRWTSNLMSVTFFAEKQQQLVGRPQTSKLLLPNAQCPKMTNWAEIGKFGLKWGSLVL